MYDFSIGVIVDSYKTDTKTAILKAADAGVRGIQMYTTYGDNAPENLTPQKRKELLDMVKSNGLVFSALCGDFGKGFGNPELNPKLIERSKRVVELAKELETDIVTTHIGVVPKDKNSDQYKIMQEACYELGSYAHSVGTCFATETGPDFAVVLKEFLDSVNSKGLCVNLDPANFVMVAGDDPVQAVYTLKDYIVHTHAKDGIKIRDANRDELYKDIEAAIARGSDYLELPLGKGGVDFDNYLKALDDIGYKGFLTIEREAGDDPEKDIRMAVEFLEGYVKNV